MECDKSGLLQLGVVLLFSNLLLAQNPIVRTQYSADPSARVFGDKVYLFPSHDILASEGKGRVGWLSKDNNRLEVDWIKFE